jgi:hypothetical protein
MCFWTISRSVIYQILAGGTKNNLQTECEKTFFTDERII